MDSNTAVIYYYGIITLKSRYCSKLLFFITLPLTCEQSIMHNVTILNLFPLSFQKSLISLNVRIFSQSFLAAVKMQNRLSC